MPICLPSFAGVVQPAGGGGFTNLKSVSFDGTDDYMSVLDIPELDSTTACTFSFWGKPASSGKSLGMESLISATDKIILYLWYNNVVYFGVRNGSSPSPASQAFTADGNWHHICGTYNGSTGTIKLYIDGSLVSTQTGAPSSTSDLSGNFIVGKSGGSDYNEGLIDEVAIFNSELSASDISTLRGGASAGTPGVPADISSLNPVGWWRMGDNDGGTGTTITNQGSASSIDGTLTNGPTFSTNVPTFNQYSVSLDGSDDYMDVPSTSDFAFGTSGFSIGFWFNAIGTNNSSGFGVNIFDMRTGVHQAKPSLWMSSKGSGSILKYYADGAYTTTFSGTINPGTWYHLLITNDGSSTKFYLNGNSTAIATGTDTTSYIAAPLKVGKYHGSNYFYNGLIDEFAIWNATLSGADATAIYNRGVCNNLSEASSYETDRTSNLIGWWRMGDNDGGTGTTITDQGSGSNNGTLINTASPNGIVTDVPS